MYCMFSHSDYNAVQTIETIENWLLDISALRDCNVPEG